MLGWRFRWGHQLVVGKRGLAPKRTLFSRVSTHLASIESKHHDNSSILVSGPVEEEGRIWFENGRNSSSLMSSWSSLCPQVWQISPAILEIKIANCKLQDLQRFLVMSFFVKPESSEPGTNCSSAAKRTSAWRSKATFQINGNGVYMYLHISRQLYT